MKKLIWLLPILASCGQNTAEQQPAVRRAATRPAVAARPVPPATSSIILTSGDRTTSGPHDTLHVGLGGVLRLEPGSKSDFAQAAGSQLLYSEARTIRQEGDGRVRRIGHTLVVRPFNGPLLRFADDTYQLRKDDNEEIDTHCQFSGSVPGRPYWLIDSLQWERYQPFLVNKYSGRATLLKWDPEISPNRQLLVVASPGLDIESVLNGLELLAISNQAVKPLWSRKLHNWQPHQARWLDDYTIAIEQVRFEPRERTTYVRLILPN
ncbi:hypothetical protein [Hymenobacter cheonanensis]|uniref:hypothetical protein n=1 Tax=Hymenobacter sp. CA2-7 TaxID=3063993 RepID=UPI0027136476|nr:hypothetical protein [Hymenobacter sp. CA2-7]MDO7887545.1 hypothetical protein [Hymenobacter sp. CA2-7]